jgi:hypothetical protein
MKCFPQLTTGATAQFPIRKWLRSRTVVNETSDSRQIKWEDAGGSSMEWELGFEGLSDEERDRLEQFFLEMEGRLGSFTFLDPTDNLLIWSEALDQPVWEKDPLLGLTPGTGDPLGTTRGTTLHNESGATARMQQTLSAPGGYVYAFSVYGRSETGQGLTLFRASGEQRDSKTYQLSENWRRLVLTGKFDSTEDTVRFGVEVAPGGRVELFGLQVEAQPAASGYKRTLSRSGVHTAARFQEDWLEMTATGPGEHSGRIRIETRA